ncbi:hypothetical protein Acr_24g0004410 [Actinidia rufa]|uniref:Uncharacterized protein n=1 Tax=Actinidia rufa TaxID=165716 RepID=A0A7J0GU43_9ERIC|nr:hypothetical protein Acr_24g0004410 [Actinidia rufa]
MCRLRYRAFIIFEVSPIRELGTMTVVEAWTKDDNWCNFQGMSGQKVTCVTKCLLPVTMLSTETPAVDHQQTVTPQGDLRRAVASEQARSTLRRSSVHNRWNAGLARIVVSAESYRGQRARRPSTTELGVVAIKCTVCARAFIIFEVSPIRELGTMTVVEAWTKDDNWCNFQGMSGQKVTCVTKCLLPVTMPSTETPTVDHQQTITPQGAVFSKTTPTAGLTVIVIAGRVTPADWTTD